MQKLIQSNLYHPNPIEITGFMVERYNKCLELLGILPTKLLNFTIDAKGWSPEIAQEKNKKQYLNNGDANPHAIIISPLQKNSKVYEPFHSFDEELMQLIFKHYTSEINDITKQAALCIDFDQHIDVFYETFDLLKYDEITISFHLINDLEKIKESQLQLVATFNEGNNFVDEKLHQKILTSVKKYGDLRNRNLELTPLKYQTSSFYTKAFGGVFVFKDFPMPVLVFESKEWHTKSIRDAITNNYDVTIFHIIENQLFKTLEGYEAIYFNIKKAANSERYERVKKHIFAQMFSHTDHPIASILENELLFKNYLNKLDIEGRKRLMCVERYLEELKQNKNAIVSSYISESLQKALYQPHSSLLDNDFFLIWKLLTKIAPKDPVNMFKYDKETFYNNFMTWDSSYQDWIIERVLVNN